MTRATRQLAIALPVVVVYLLMLLGVIGVPVISEQRAGEVLPVIPFWLLVTFGAYSLGSLGLGLLRFNDCPEAYESLLKEIGQAKDELRNQGVSVD